MMNIFFWFDANCAWLYNNMCIFKWMFLDCEMALGASVLKCILMSLWYMLIGLAPALILIRGFGYIIGGWTGMLPSFFVNDD